MFNFIILAALSLLSTVHAATFLPSSGPFNTTLTIHALIDHTRLDPYSPTPSPRSLMISIFRPSTCIGSPSPYVDPLTASWTDSQFAEYGIPPGTFSTLNLLTCPPPHHPHQSSSNPEIRNEKDRKEKFPLVLFSSGLGNPRLWYSAMAQEVASRGFVVVTIDHPYDAGIVVFPDNSTILGANITTDPQIEFDLSVRVADVSFVLDHFSASNAGIFGHSLGGATAAQAMLEDKRLVGGVSLDGGFFPPLSVPSSPVKIKNPFLIFARPGHNLTTSADPSFGAIWPKLLGFKRLLALQNSTHGTFTDLPDIVDVLGLKGKLPAEVGEILGTIDGERAMNVLGEYVGAFFGMALKGQKEGLLIGPSTEWPEVVFVEGG